MDKEQNDLAYILAERFFKAAREFMREHPNADINAVIGAANAVIVSSYLYAPDKKTALDEIEEDFEILRNILRITPDMMFGSETEPNLN